MDCMDWFSRPVRLCLDTAFCVVSWAAVFWWLSWAEVSEMAHSHDWVSVKSSAGGCQLECYGSLYVVLHMAFKKEYCVCIKPEAAELLEYNLESCICHFCLVYWSKEILGPVWIQAEKRLWLFMAGAIDRARRD